MPAPPFRIAEGMAAADAARETTETPSTPETTETPAPPQRIVRMAGTARLKSRAIHVGPGAAVAAAAAASAATALATPPPRPLPGAVEIPTRMLTLPRDPRGYPVPFVLHQPEEGATFYTTDMGRFGYAATRRRCGICGDELGYWLWFLGGPAEIDSRHFRNCAMHEECVRYALAVCPFLAFTAPDYAAHMAVQQREGGDRERPDQWGLYQGRDYKLRANPNGEFFLRASPPREVAWIPVPKGNV